MTAEVATGNCPIAGGDFENAGSATGELKRKLKLIGASPDAARRAVIAAYEAELNVVIHATSGTMQYAIDNDKVDVLVSDVGPGIPDIDRAMQEGFSTASPKARELGFGAGMGLPNILKNTDDFEISSEPGVGTKVSFRVFLTPQTPAEARHASVRVIEERCNGCLRCVTACPTHALRVRGNQPRLLEHLCIDCAEGMAVCPQRVFALPHGAADELPQECVLVAPSALLAQFPGRVGAEKLRNALRDKGVRDLIVSDGYEAALRKAVARYAMSEARNLPVIAPFCPAVVNLIEFRFPSLIGHLAPFLSPLEAALMDTKGRRSVFAVLCPSQATALRRLGLPAENMLTPAAVCQAARPSLNGSAASARMENPAAGSDAPGRLEVSGIRHVKSVLESLENGRLKDVSILELYSCDQGCFGSPLLFVNPFVARCRWSPEPETGGRAVPAFRRQKSFSPRRGVRLDDDMALAIEKLGGIDRLAKSLPGKNCAACGAPDCASFAEDVVLGRAVLSECPHLKDTEVRREAN